VGRVVHELDELLATASLEEEVGQAFGRRVLPLLTDVAFLQSVEFPGSPRFLVRVELDDDSRAAVTA